MYALFTLLVLVALTSSASAGPVCTTICNPDHTWCSTTCTGG